MDCNSPILDENTLRQMSYTELKKMAKKRGIIKKRGSMKAEKIISKLMSSVSSDEMESFSTPLSKEINSSKKNKENQFNQDAMTPLQTPRRGTYSVETPSCILVDKIVEESVYSPSQKTPDMDISNITILRGSERKLRPRKVSFVSPQKRTPRTPTKYISLKDRPKTPIASKSSGRRVSLSTPAAQPSQSHLVTNKVTDDSGSVVKSATKEVTAAKIKRTATPSSTLKIASKANMAVKVKRAATPSSALKSATKENTATKIKRVATPNFQRIHQRAFDKMESIDVYHQRLKESAKKVIQISKQKSKVTKPKTKIPVPFSGIPFIPSATSCVGLKINFSSGMPKSFTGEKKETISQRNNNNATAVKTRGKQRVVPPALNENALLKNKKPKFDLQASLSRKLGYKPYKGVLKPLSESNCTSSPIPACYHNSVKEPVNKVVRGNRAQTRNALRGVRTNKRFELQMKNRKVE